MKRAFYTFLAVLCVILGGCADTPPVPPKLVYVAVLPDDDFLIDCALQAPPDKQEFIAANDDKQKQMLVDVYNGATNNGILCNSRLKSLREWKVKQKALYPDAPADAPSR
jgi:hypothetical protein